MKQYDDELISFGGKKEQKIDAQTLLEMAEEVPDEVDMGEVSSEPEKPQIKPIAQETDPKEIVTEQPEKHPGGRPLKFKTPEEMEAMIERYFNEDLPTKTVMSGKGENKYPVEIPCPTVTGLCLYLGFADRISFLDYEKRKEFSSTIKSARTAIERHYEELLQTGLGVGAIFALKNFGWKDRSEMDVDPDGVLAAAVARVQANFPENKN